MCAAACVWNATRAPPGSPAVRPRCKDNAVITSRTNRASQFKLGSINTAHYSTDEVVAPRWPNGSSGTPCDSLIYSSQWQWQLQQSPLRPGLGLGACPVLIGHIRSDPVHEMEEARLVRPLLRRVINILHPKFGRESFRPATHMSATKTKGQ